MAYVDPAELAYKAGVFRPARIVDANGHYKDAPVKVCDVRCGIRPLSGKEKSELGMESDVETLQFILNWSARGSITEDMYFVWRERRYEILYIDPVPFAEQYLRVRAQRHEANGKDWM